MVILTIILTKTSIENTSAPTPVEETIATRLRRTKTILLDPPKFNGSRSEYEG